MDLRKLLQKVEAVPSGSPELDSEFESTFRSAPPYVTRSIDAAGWLIETELPGWWWDCERVALRNGASLYVPGSSQIQVDSPNARIPPDFEPRPEHLRLLQDPKRGKVFNRGACQGQLPLSPRRARQEGLPTGRGLCETP